MAFGTPGVVASAEELLHRNQEISKVHKPLLFFDETPGGHPKPKTFIFCCTDQRCNPAAFLGLNDGDAIVLRNAGGVVAPELISFITLEYYVGSLEDIFVIQHTDCGATHITEDQIKGHLEDLHLGTEKQVSELEFPVGITLEQRVRVNVKAIKDSPFIRDELKARTKGLIFDIKTGKLTEVQ